jgi:Superinfection immunity protein/Short C-terminal domain
MDGATQFGAIAAVAIIVAIIVGTIIYLLPTYIAFKRQHEYRWVIFGINFIAGATVIGWLVAFIWAVFPSNRSFADPVLGNPSGAGNRNAGHTLGEVNASMGRSSTEEYGASSSALSLDAIERLAVLLQRKVITEEEFARKKAELLSKI